MTFAAVGTFFGAANSATFTFAPAGLSSAGHFALVEVTQGAAGVTATGITSSNATWVQIGTTFSGATNTGSCQVFRAQITSTSSATATITYSGTASSEDVAGQEFTTSAGFSSVTFDVQGHIDGTGTNTWASLTPGHGAGELYFGMAVDSGTFAGTNGSPSGYVYQVTGGGNGLAYNVSCPNSATGALGTDGGSHIGVMVLVYENTTYRLWPSASGGALAGYSGPFVGATQFAVAGGGYWLNGYYIWVPTGGDTSPSGGYNTALWSLTTGASSGSGSLVSGSVVTGVTGLTANAWNYIALTTPIQLAPGWDANSTANGSIYVAAVGWTAANGFADTNNYWGTGAGANGITNGPLIGYSSNSGTSNKAPYGMAQGLFSSSTANAASTLPNQVSGTDNFWVDVQVSSTAPAGYTGSYRLWPNKYDTNDFTTGDQPSPGENYTVSTEISLTQSCTLNNVWYWSPNGLNGSTTATTLATRCDVWNVSTGLSVASITSPTWLTPSGGAATAGGGWVKAAFAGGVTLPAGDYRVSIYNSSGTTDINWNAKDASTDYWGETATNSIGASGITWGPVSAPGWSASSGGYAYNTGGASNTPPYSGSSVSHTQPAFYQPNPNTGPVGFPQLYAAVGGSSNQTQNYWVDLEVTPLAPAPVVLVNPLPPFMFPPLSRKFGPNPPFEVAQPYPSAVTAVTVQGTATLTGVGGVTSASGAGSGGTMGGGGAVNAPAVLQAVATAAGAGGVTSAAVLGAVATLAGSGAVTDTAVLGAVATLAGAGAVGSAAGLGAGGQLGGAGGIAAPGVLLAPATMGGGGALVAGGAVSAPAALAGAGAVSALATLAAVALLAGQGGITANLAVAAIATLAGQGSVNASAGQGSQLGGTGGLAAPGIIAAPATLAAAGGVTAVAVGQAVAALAGRGALTALDIQTAVALLAGLGTVTGTGADVGPGTHSGAATLAGAGQVNPSFLTLVLGYARAGTNPIATARAGQYPIPYATGGQNV